MTRFINTALIGLASFVLILALLWLVVNPAAPGMATQGADAPTAITVRTTKAAWSEEGAGQDLAVEVVLRNAGLAAGAVTQVAYRATLDGQPLAAGTTSPPVSVPEGLDVPVHFTVRMPADLASRWLRAVEAGEPMTLKVDGSVVVRTAAADQRLPYAWSATSASHLLEHLAAAPQDCPGPPAPLCLQGLDGAFAAGGLEATVELRNDRSDPLRVRNGTFRLVFEDVTVAAGTATRELEIAPGDDAEIVVTLRFDDEALRQWWAGHAQRCESSRLALAMSLEVESVGDGPSAVEMEVLASPLKTGLLCRGSA